MARQRTFYPTMNRKLYDLKYYLDEYKARMLKLTAVAGAELTAINDLHTALNNATDVLGEYKELR